MISNRIVRIRSPALRLPIWIAWWPLGVLDCAVNTIAAGHWRCLGTWQWWNLQMVVLEIGITGVHGSPR